MILTAVISSLENVMGITFHPGTDIRWRRGVVALRAS
jgi:hypothetical protein